MDEHRNEEEALPQNHHLLIYVIGCPGSGKGTLCKLLVQAYSCHHISVGDLLRNISNDQTDRTLEVTGYVREGTLVPTGIVVDILKDAIERELGACPAVIVDGFPRRLDQGIASEDQLGKPDLVLFFDCKRSIAVDRYLTRKLDGRLDDNEEMFHRRYEEFQRLNPDVLDYYRNLGVLVTINTNEETKISYQRLLETLNSNEKWRM